jgi:hypothetical protein
VPQKGQELWIETGRIEGDGNLAAVVPDHLPAHLDGGVGVDPERTFDATAGGGSGFGRTQRVAQPGGAHVAERSAGPERPSGGRGNRQAGGRAALPVTLQQGGALYLDRGGRGPAVAVGKQGHPGSIDPADAGSDREAFAGAELERAGHLLMVFPGPACRSGLDSEPAASQVAHGAAVTFEVEQGRGRPSVLDPWDRPTVEPSRTPSLIGRHAVAAPSGPQGYVGFGWIAPSRTAGAGSKVDRER